jgi:hypothetical protein
VHTLAARLFNSRSSASPTRTVTSRRPRTTSTGSSASCRRTGLGSEPALDRRGASFPTGRRASRSPSSRKPASHLYCGQHLYENVKRNHSADIASAFLKALRATTFPEYARSLGAIADLLAARGPSTTSRGSRPIDERQTCTVWQLGRHEPVEEDQWHFLRLSPRIINEALDFAGYCTHTMGCTDPASEPYQLARRLCTFGPAERYSCTQIPRKAILWADLDHFWKVSSRKHVSWVRYRVTYVRRPLALR